MSDLFAGSSCINTECVLSKFKLEEFNCLRKPPEDYKTEGHFSGFSLTVFSDFKCYLQPEALKPGHGVLSACYWVLKGPGMMPGVNGLLQLRFVGDDLKCMRSTGNCHRKHLSLPGEKWRPEK